MQKIEIIVLNRKSESGSLSLTRIFALRKDGKTDEIRKIDRLGNRR